MILILAKVAMTGIYVLYCMFDSLPGKIWASCAKLQFTAFC